MRILTTIIPILLLSFLLVSCGQKDYYQAVKEQNITMQLRMENERLIREDKKQQHEKDKIVLIEKLSTATGKTENTNDDFMAAMMLLMTEDKNNMADIAYNLTKKDLTLQPIKAPDSIGDTIQKAGPTLLGLGGIWLGITQSDNIKDVAVSGIENAGASSVYGSASNYKATYTDTNNDKSVNSNSRNPITNPGTEGE